EGCAATFGATRACPGACAFYKTKGPLARPFRSALATILGRPEHRCRHLAVVEHLALGPNGDVKVAHAPAHLLLAHPQPLERAAEGRHCQRLLLLLLAPRAIGVVEVVERDAGPVRCQYLLAVEALHVAVWQQALARRAVVVGAGADG